MTDPNKNFWDRAKELFSRFTDQCIQTWSGYWFATGMNTFGQVNDVSHGYGMTAIDIGLEGDRAITIGYMTAGPKDIRRTGATIYLFMNMVTIFKVKN